MMQNEKVNLREDAEISLKDILWKILIQWRMILIFSLLTAAGLTCVKYKKDWSEYNAAVENKIDEKKASKQTYTEDELDELKEVLSDAELNAVETAVLNEQKILTDQKYLDSSLLMQLDSQNEHVVYMDYYLSDMESGFSALLCQAFSSRFKDEEVLSNISEAMDVDVDSSDLEKVMGEMVGISYYGTTNTTSTVSGEGYEVSDDVYPVICVSVILPTDADVEKVEKAVNSSMESLSEELNETVGKHKLNFLEGYDRYIIDNNVKNTQNNVQSEILNCESANISSLSSFTDDQKALYKAEVVNIKNQMGISDSEVDESKTEEAFEEPQAKPSFSKKYFVAGFAVGLIVYIICYMLMVALRHKVSYGEDIADVTDLRKFGEYHKYFKKSFGRFIWSKRVYKRYYRRYLNLSEVSTSTSDKISVAAALTNDSRKLTLLTLGDSSALSSAFTEAVTNKLAAAGNRAEAKQYSVQTLLTDAFAVKSLEKVILVIRQDKTSYDELDEFLNMAVDYKIPVMGYIYTE